MAPGSFWLMPWALFSAHSVCYSYISKWRYLKGYPASSEICNLLQVLWWPLLLCTQSAIPTEESHTWARASASYSLGTLNASWACTWKMVKSVSGACRKIEMSFYKIPIPQGRVFIHTLASRCPSHRVISCRTAQLSVQRLITMALE